MSSMKDHLESTKASQEKLRSMQQKRDRGLTFGSDYKHPCKKVNLDFYFQGCHFKR